MPNPLLGMENEMPPMGGEMPMDDSMMGEDPMMARLVNDAFASNEFNDMGEGVEMASEEEQQMLQAIVDGIEEAIHGPQADQIVELFQSYEQAYEGIAAAAHALCLSAFMQGHEQGVEVPTEVFLAENGAVQVTVELLWEVAEAINMVDPDDEEQAAAAYFDTLRRLGETILELDDPTAVASAQEYLFEMELGFDVNAEDYMDIPMEDEMMMGGGMEPGVEYDFAPDSMRGI